MKKINKGKDKKLEESPIDLLVAIVERNKGDNVCELLNENQAVIHVNCIGNGTAESGIAELFGFGIAERDIVFSIVCSKSSEKIVQDLNDKFQLETRKNGLAFTIPINSVEKGLLDLVKIK